MTDSHKTGGGAYIYIYSIGSWLHYLNWATKQIPCD